MEINKKIELKPLNTLYTSNNIKSNNLSLNQDINNNSILQDSIKLEPLKLKSISNVSFIENNFPNNIKTSNQTYTLNDKKLLSNGTIYYSYIANNKSPAKTVRFLEFSPNSVNFNVQFSSNGSGISVNNLSLQKNLIGAINGVTMTEYKPIGDIKGISSDGKVEVYQFIGNNTAINNRYGLGITYDGKVEIVKGGLEGKQSRLNPNSPDKYKTFISGAALLFNSKDDFKSEDEFLKSFIKRNCPSLVKNMRPHQNLQRSAIGIKDNGNIVLITFGEGQYRRGADGTDAYTMYQILKSLGVKEALMLDGGGAPVMIAKDNNKTLIKTTPHIQGGYDRNASFLVISKK